MNAQVNAPATAVAAPRKPVEGFLDNKKFLHPKFIANYGNWKYHDRPRPGVLHHVSHTGDQVWTVRAGTQRQMDHYTIRKLCDIADKFGEGFCRFTIRSNVEISVSSEAKVAPLIAAEDATIVDTDGLAIDQVVARIVALVRQAEAEAR